VFGLLVTAFVGDRVCVRVHVAGISQNVHIVTVMVVHSTKAIPKCDIVGDQNAPSAPKLLVALEGFFLALIYPRGDDSLQW
jgi:hypothetical protein